MGYLILLAMLIVQIAKRADGAGVLRCTRADGSVTWQKQTRHAMHFALHDLTHFAVESTLGSRRGFFGLIAEGWEIDDTTGKGLRGRLPQEAVEVEHIVGMFDTERARAEDDMVIERSGATVLIDPISLNYLAGSEIDFVDDLIGSSFKVNNPNATASCGCGTSFAL